MRQKENGKKQERSPPVNPGSENVLTLTFANAAVRRVAKKYQVAYDERYVKNTEKRMKKESRNKLQIRNGTAEFLTFAYQTGGDGIAVRIEGGTIWLSQTLIAELFQTTKQNIGGHIKKILDDEELDVSVVKNFFTTAADGKNYSVLHYNSYVLIFPYIILIENNRH